MARPRIGMGAARTIPLICMLAALSGCAAPQGVCPRATPNLALGPIPSVNRLAEQHTLRSSWPSVEGGYYFDDVTDYSISSYDRQFFYDRLGGEHEQLTESVRTGVRVR